MIICQIIGEINNETMVKLIASFNEAAKLKTNVHIYLNSEGGDVESMECILHLINNSKRTTILTAYGKIYSASFFIFFRAECKRNLLPGTMGMCHYIRTSIQIDERNKAYYSEDKAYQSWIKDQNVWTNELCIKLGFTKTEMSRLKKREEIYFQYSRLLDFMKKKNVK